MGPPTFTGLVHFRCGPANSLRRRHLRIHLTFAVPYGLFNVRHSIPPIPTTSIPGHNPIFRFVLTMLCLPHISISFPRVQNDTKRVQLVFRYSWTVPWSVVDVPRRRFLAVRSNARLRKRPVYNQPERGHQPLGLVSGCHVFQPNPALACICPRFRPREVRKLRPEAKLVISIFFARQKQFSLVQPRGVHRIPGGH